MNGISHLVLVYKNVCMCHVFVFYVFTDNWYGCLDRLSYKQFNWTVGSHWSLLSNEWNLPLLWIRVSMEVSWLWFVYSYSQIPWWFLESHGDMFWCDKCNMPFISCQQSWKHGLSLQSLIEYSSLWSCESISTCAICIQSCCWCLLNWGDMQWGWRWTWGNGFQGNHLLNRLPLNQ